jgi:putative FmdB family regulatory protein
MPRYDFVCGACSVRVEHIFAMSARPETLTCECGGEARHTIVGTPNVFMRGAPYEFRRDKVVGNNGALVGRSAEKQHRIYQQMHDQAKKANDRRKRGLGKHGASVEGLEVLGVMPGEMVDSIGQQEGDKEIVSKDPEYFLRKTGLHLGD